MHIKFILPVAAAIALAACGSSEDQPTGKPMNEAEIAKEAAEAIAPNPGKYRSTMTLIEMDVPGLTKQQQDMAKAGFDQASQAREHCLTPEEAAAGPEQMVTQMSDSGNCKFAKFEINGNKLNAEMSCSPGDGAGQGPGEGMSGNVKMSGIIGPNTSSIVIDAEQQMPGMPGVAKMKMQIDNERIGDCDA